MSQIVVPPRSEIPVEYTWNAESVFESPQVCEAECDALSALLPTLARFQGHLADGPATLAEWLEVFQDTSRRILKVYCYSYIARAVDTTNQQAAALAMRGRELAGRAQAAAAFAIPEILAIGPETIHAWMEQEPRLAIYAHYFDNLFRQQAHIRPAEVEELLGMLSSLPRSIEATEEALVNAEIVFRPAVNSNGESIPVAHGNMDRLLNSPDRELRRTAWESYADGYLAFKNTLAANYAVAVQLDVMAARARRYSSSLEAALFRENIPPEVFHSLVKACRAYLPTWHRYWAVRRRALGVETLYPYDVWAPITRYAPAIPYRQAVDWVSAGLAPLGDEYVDALRRGCLEERWVDVYPNQGKVQTAFSFGAPDTFPFICMSYGDDLSSMSTLAHELGHSMHGYCTNRTQPIIYCIDYSLFISEVPSNFHQAMVRAYLLENNPDPEFQIALIEEAMDNFHRYFFIMPTLARFEMEVHQRVERGEALSADFMIDLMADLFGEGYGSEMAYDRQRVGITWAQFGHLYIPFYVFQYAVGISGAHALAKRILDGVPGAAEDYRRFISAGVSRYALDLLKAAGVDMSTPAPVDAAFEVLDSYIDRLERLVAQREAQQGG